MLIDLMETYEYLHKNPELSYKEFATSKYIEESLTKLGIKTYRVDPTGVLGIIDNRSDVTIGFRADIDALPITEKNEHEYVSKNVGVMHACGHDAHVSMLLKSVETMLENDYKYNIMLILQPAEEVDGGAKLIIEHPIFKKYKPSKIFGMHLWPELDSGVIATRSGALMGTNVPFKLEFKGTSSHVCNPHLGSDCMQALAETITNINYIVAKTNNPFEPVVINVGKVMGGTSGNIIASDVEVLGTMRATNNIVLKSLKEQFEESLQVSKIKYGVDIGFEQTEITYPVVYNSPSLVDQITNHMPRIKLLEYPSLASEDFGFYSNICDCVFFFLGTKEEDHNMPLHSESFSINPSVLQKGVDLYVELARIYGKQSSN